MSENKFKQKIRKQIVRNTEYCFRMQDQLLSKSLFMRLALAFPYILVLPFTNLSLLFVSPVLWVKRVI